MKFITNYQSPIPTFPEVGNKLKATKYQTALSDCSQNEFCTYCLRLSIVGRELMPNSLVGHHTWNNSDGNPYWEIVDT